MLIKRSLQNLRAVPVIRRRNGAVTLSQTRWLSTASTTTTTSAAPAVESQAKSKDDEDKGGIPWGLLIPLGIFGSIIAYFMRGSRNEKKLTAFRVSLRGELVMSPEELAQLRESNKISANVFAELCRRAKQAFPFGKVNLSQFLDGFCVDQLGGEFQGRGSLKSRHILERISKSLGDEVDLDVALLVLSLTVMAEPEELLQKLFPVLKDDEEGMSYERLVDIITKLELTNQIPVRYLVRTVTSYPLNEYSKASMSEVACKGIAALNPNQKDKKMDEFVRERQKQLFNEKDFISVVLSNDVCLWGACWHKKS